MAWTFTADLVHWNGKKTGKPLNLVHRWLYRSFHCWLLVCAEPEVILSSETIEAR